jgi:hypothetical protein
MRENKRENFTGNLSNPNGNNPGMLIRQKEIGPGHNWSSVRKTKESKYSGVDYNASC